ncbi:MAG: hypothetical protein D6734_09025 [Candidatus Schekmanbacteria bacterium]|nr:MAG: hypothetical protein D6734_09025 [Candidatus Schekmanbacteria bacterium]
MNNRVECGINLNPTETKCFSGTAKDFFEEIKNKKVSNLSNCQSLQSPLVTLCPMYAAYTMLYRIKGGVCLVHGPSGCSMHRNVVSFLYKDIREISTELCNPFENRAFTTKIVEDDIVFGAEEKLFNAILEIHNRLKPEVVWVFSTCSTAIIGDDVESVVKNVQKRTGKKVKAINCAGIKGLNWKKGYHFAYSQLMSLVEKEEKVPQLVNVINMASITKNDMEEIKRVLSMAGISVRFIPYYSSIEEIRKSSSAIINAVLCGSGGRFYAKMMKEKFGMEYVSGLQPIGISESRRWFIEIVEKTGCSKKAAAKIEEEALKSEKEFKEISARLKNKRLFISGGAPRVLSILKFCLELGMKPIGIGFYHYDLEEAGRLEEILNKYGENPWIFTGQNYIEQEKFLIENKPDLFIGNRMTKNRILPLNIPTVSVNAYGNCATHLGFRGAISFAADIEKSIK